MIIALTATRALISYRTAARRAALFYHCSSMSETGQAGVAAWHSPVTISSAAEKWLLTIFLESRGQ